jgi:hypothetical protein
MQRLILEISGPRMGSTNLRRHLSAFAKVEALGEFFNPKAGPPEGPSEDLCQDISAAMAARGLPRPSDPRALGRLAVAHPLDAVSAALDACARRGTPLAVLKLAPGHLPSQAVRRIVQRFHPFGIVLHRAPIDQFISREKALSLRAWEAVDTTALRPDIRPPAFRAWRWRQENHLRMGLHLLRRYGCPHLVFRYEEVYADPARTGETLARAFREAGFDLGARSGRVAELPRQDRARSRADKVGNWAAFEAGLSRGRSVDLERYDVEGSGLLLDAQMAAERLLPRAMLRGVAKRLRISGMPERGTGAQR